MQLCSWLNIFLPCPLTKLKVSCSRVFVACLSCLRFVAVPSADDDANATSRNIEVRQVGVAQALDESLPPQVDLDVSYSNACEQLQKLELQLSRRGDADDL